MGPAKRRDRGASSCPLPGESGGRTHFSQHPCVTTHTDYCPPGKLTCTLVSRVYIGDQLCRHGLLADLGLQPFQGSS